MDGILNNYNVMYSPLSLNHPTGDIGQSALIGYVAQVTGSEIFLGPQGMFANSTAAPKLFTLERISNLNIPYLTRAEIFAGIDSEWTTLLSFAETIYSMILIKAGNFFFFPLHVLGFIICTTRYEKSNKKISQHLVWRDERGWQ